MTQAAVLAQMGSNNTTFRNRIINGAMMIDQRNAGASVTPTDGQYTLDRWFFAMTQASKFTSQQNQGSVTPPAGFTNYLGVTSSSAYSVLAGDIFRLSQAIEGFNVADLNWGTANAQAVTLSFWVRSSLTGAFGGSLINSAANRSYPFTFTVNSANTWEYKTITIAGDTTGTWVTNNGMGLRINFSLGTGSTFSASAGAWAAGNYLSSTGATSVVGTNGATFYITGVQLEAGTNATPFEVRPYGTELALCQRYFARVIDPPMRGVGNGGTSGGASRMALFFPQTMRAAPTVTINGTFTFWNGGSTTTATTLAGYFQGGNNGIDMDFNTAASFTVGQAVCAYCTGDTNKYVNLSAEL